MKIQIKINAHEYYEFMQFHNPLKMRLGINMSKPASKNEELFEIRYNENLNEMFRYFKFSTN